MSWLILQTNTRLLASNPRVLIRLAPLIDHEYQPEPIIPSESLLLPPKKSAVRGFFNPHLEVTMAMENDFENWLDLDSVSRPTSLSTDTESRSRPTPVSTKHVPGMIWLLVADFWVVCG